MCWAAFGSEWHIKMSTVQMDINGPEVNVSGDTRTFPQHHQSGQKNNVCKKYQLNYESFLNHFDNWLFIELG